MTASPHHYTTATPLPPNLLPSPMAGLEERSCPSPLQPAEIIEDEDDDGGQIDKLNTNSSETELSLPIATIGDSVMYFNSPSSYRHEADQ